jgi:(p)ppGpp synthase/HD superfamily hydrolase
VEVRWKQAGSREFPARILAVAEDREGLLRDIATVVAEEGHNIESAEVLTDRRGTARVRIVVALTSIGELTRLLNRLHLVRNVTEVRREIGEQVANAPPNG